MSTPRVAVLASGRGSNFEALVRASQSGVLGAEVVLLVASSPTTGALERAASLGIPAQVIPTRPPATHEQALLQALEDVDLVCLAGWLPLVPERVVEAFAGRMLNIHPSLLPLHGGPGMHGLRVHAAVLAAGGRESGCSVHEVTTRLDEGLVLGQERVPVLPGDTADTLAARVLEAEHRLYPTVVATVAARLQ